MAKRTEGYHHMHSKQQTKVPWSQPLPATTEQLPSQKQKLTSGRQGLWMECGKRFSGSVNVSNMCGTTLLASRSSAAPFVRRLGGGKNSHGAPAAS